MNSLDMGFRLGPDATWIGASSAASGVSLTVYAASAPQRYKNL